MTFYIQDPTFPDSYSLHEALISACMNAQYGGGAYAFVSQDGIKLLLDDDAFKVFIRKGKFKLIVGIDDVTNENALKKLKELKGKHPGLEILAFSHDVRNSLFHPKFSWFKNNRGGLLIIGSGNLTARGLRRNWEAFSVVDVDHKQFKEIEKDWNSWLRNCASFLKSIDSNEVLERVKLNLRVAVKKRFKPKIKEAVQEEIELKESEVLEDINAWDFVSGDAVLIAEIPKGGNRWNQANFDLESFTKFFGAKPGNKSLRILLRNILKDGSFADIEIRPSVSVKSHNYRFELEAASVLSYPPSGRPVAIFIRVSTRMFLYVIVMPSDDYYNEVRNFIDPRWRGRADRMKRLNTTVEELQNNIPDLPFWKIA